ncbi:aspartate beta-hydroxylase domain-containing protein 2-like [Asterias amurensis]|uniref:aspartate beta-hydroxylase domain-containing protein 2-like n=1 Tax=Asterias amurensis TaxID=7602 RepID=UPI003AB68E00
MEFDMLQHPLLLFLTIGSGIIITMIIFCFQRKETQTKSDNNSLYYDKFSKCTSPGCVRCNNYELLKTDLSERLLAYEKEISKDGGCKGMELKRVQTSIENSAEVDQEPSGLNSLQKPNVFTLEGLDAIPWCDDKFLSEISVLEGAVQIVIQEYEEMLNEQNIAEDFQGWVENDVPDGMWSVFHLFNQGRKIEENCARCPKTVAILEEMESFMSGCVFGNATFSVLEAGTHITEHYGPCNLRIRCHLGLHIPRDCCTLTVAHQRRHWREGKCLLFDDSFLHEARHAGSQAQGPRVVLLLDFWHPDITSAERDALRHLFHL